EPPFGAAGREAGNPAGDRRNPRPLGQGDVNQVEHTERYSRAVVRVDGNLPRTRWTIEPIQLEELVLSYLTRASTAPGDRLASTAGQVLR
ncbi:hypothetical protein ACWDV4_30300, partial [Micromonospora sp. NPDC003197]